MCIKKRIELKIIDHNASEINNFYLNICLMIKHILSTDAANSEIDLTVSIINITIFEVKLNVFTLLLLF